MNKVEFEIERNQDKFMEEAINLWNFDWNELRLFDKYYLKNKSFTNGRNIVLIEFVNDEIKIDKISIEDLDEGRTALIIEFIMKLKEEKEYVKAKKRKSIGKKIEQKGKEKTGYIKINNRYYEDSVNKNRGYNLTAENFSVRGHVRTYKDGKRVFIKSYKKRSEENEKSK